MADTCIVCLGDLPIEPLPDPNAPTDAAETRNTPPLVSSIAAQKQPANTNNSADADAIAYILPCAHNLHNDCLKPWVERANSCPMCRAQFHEVELKDYVDGPTIGSYAVQDKQ